MPNDVIAAGPGLVAVGALEPGSLNEEKVIWTSSDGAATWQRVLEERPGLVGGTLYSLAEHDGRLVAIGTLGECDVVAFWSDDGVEWQAGSITPDPAVCLSYMYDVIAVPTGFLAVGSVFSKFAGVWTSPDGETWTEHLVGGGGRMGSVVAIDNGFVAAGAETFIVDFDLDSLGDNVVVFGGELPTPVGYAWTSLDGISWQEITVFDSLALDELVVGARWDPDRVRSGRERRRRLEEHRRNAMGVDP